MRSSASAVAWTAAVLTSALGAAILFAADPGINWPIWVAAASVSLILSRLVAVGRVETPLLVLTAWATVLAVVFALTDNEVYALIVASDAMLLGLATITLGAGKVERPVGKAARRSPPFLAPFRVATTSAREVADAPNSVSSPRSRSIIKGALLSVPLVIVLIALLGSADPIIRWSADRLTAWLPDWSFPPRVLFFAFLLTLTLGANSIARLQLAPKLPQYPDIGVTPRIGLTRQHRMVLWSAAAVLWLFVLLQASYLSIRRRQPSAPG